MRNDLHHLKNDVAALLEQQQNTETRQADKDQRRELKETAAARSRVFIIDAINTGETLASIYNDRETIIETIKDDIKSDVYYVDDISTLKDVKRAVNRYTIDDAELDGIVSLAFYNEFIKVERDYTKAYNLIKKQLRQDLRALILQLIDERPDDLTPPQIFAALEYEQPRADVIEQLATTNTEREILDEIYRPTLAKVKRDYPKTNTEPSGHVLPLPWRIIAAYKAIGKIWKL